MKLLTTHFLHFSQTDENIFTRFSLVEALKVQTSWSIKSRVHKILKTSQTTEPQFSDGASYFKFLEVLYTVFIELNGFKGKRI